MELEPVPRSQPRLERDTMPGFGRFPFAAHRPRVDKKKRRRDETYVAPGRTPVFTVITTEAINNSAFIVPDFDSSSAVGTQFWSVPPMENWVEY
jgi:hypothetical protein